MNTTGYLIITGYHYDNSCNPNDIYKFSNTLEDAIISYEKIKSKKHFYNNKLLKDKLSVSDMDNSQWVHIVDLQTKKIILDSKKLNSKL
jgi:hypothetical protein